MEEQGVEFMQFAYRWMHCLLMREISVKCTIRMWDTYLVSSASVAFPDRNAQIFTGRPGRGHGRLFSVSPIRLFSIFVEMERPIEGNGLSGTPLRS